MSVSLAACLGGNEAHMFVSVSLRVLGKQHHLFLASKKEKVFEHSWVAASKLPLLLISSLFVSTPAISGHLIDDCLGPKKLRKETGSSFSPIVSNLMDHWT